MAALGAVWYSELKDNKEEEQKEEEKTMEVGKIDGWSFFLNINKWIKKSVQEVTGANWKETVAESQFGVSGLKFAIWTQSMDSMKYCPVSLEVKAYSYKMCTLYELISRLHG